MRIVDVLLSMPSLLLSLSIIILLGFGTVNAAIAVGVTSIAPLRPAGALARWCACGAPTMSRRPSAAAARFGAVLWRHILPNSADLGDRPAPRCSSAPRSCTISTLGFLGYGAPPPTPEWGLLIAEGRNYIATAWWLTTAARLVVVLVVLAANRISRSIGQERRS